MTYIVYILESVVDGTLYIGQTQNLASRIEKHNKGFNKLTKAKRPWKIIGKLEVETRSAAMKLEKKLKNWKKREAILNYINKFGV
ncbi:MAG: GIY-YIG nuclease family protein, partial [Prolixibacteraceae bacterium]|nr:GIY-YIG nuclease family protein [Prolixibacteraceae bacterium]